MKTMSQVLSVADCPETMDEARQIIRALSESKNTYIELTAEECAEKNRLLQALKDAQKLLDEAATYLTERNLGEPARLLMGRLIAANAAAMAAINS